MVMELLVVRIGLKLPILMQLSIVQIYDTDAGYEMPFEIGWDPTEKYVYIADQGNGVILVENATPNTWYHIKAALNTTDGEVKVQVNNTGEITEFFSTPGLIPQELDFLIQSISNVGIDNIIVSATSTDPFLAVSDVNSAKSKIFIVS